MMTEEEKEFARLFHTTIDLLDSAWKLISNLDKDSPEWQESASRWGELYNLEKSDTVDNPTVRQVLERQIEDQKKELDRMIEMSTCLSCNQTIQPYNYHSEHPNYRPLSKS